METISSPPNGVSLMVNCLFSCVSSSRRANFPPYVHVFVRNPTLYPYFVFERLGEVERDWVSLWEVWWVCERLSESVRGWVRLWEIEWVCKRLGEVETGWVICERVGEFVQCWGTLWEIGRFCVRLSGSLRGWLSLLEAGCVCEILDESMRGWVRLWDFGWIYERLGKSLSGWVSLWEGQFVNTEDHEKIAVLVQSVPLLAVPASESWQRPCFLSSSIPPNKTPIWGCHRILNFRMGS